MSEEIYRSSNGDRWLLIRERHVVRHEPNLASGGRVTEVPIEEFLARTGSSPQNEALRDILEPPAAEPSSAGEDH